MKTLSCILTALALVALVDRANAEFVCRLPRHGYYSLALRGGPGDGFPAIERVYPHTPLDVLDARGPWRYVRTAYGFNLVGWLHSRHVCWW
jgi:hypothetical protein